MWCHSAELRLLHHPLPLEAHCHAVYNPGEDAADSHPHGCYSPRCCYNNRSDGLGCYNRRSDAADMHAGNVALRHRSARRQLSQAFRNSLFRSGKNHWFHRSRY